MAVYCEYCGQLIEADARFCVSCGAPAPTVQGISEQASSGQGTTIVSGSGNYSVILTSLGTCARAAAADLLEDTLGYSEPESADLFLMLPAQIAQRLSSQQANYLAQALTEYGMEVSVSNGNEYVTINEADKTQSVFDMGGSFLGKVLSVLGTITGFNRMRKFRRLEDPNLFAHPYRPRTYHPAPPVHVRRNIRTAVPQGPVPGKPQDFPSARQVAVHETNHTRHPHTRQHTQAHSRLQGFNEKPDGRQKSSRSQR